MSKFKDIDAAIEVAKESLEGAKRHKDSSQKRHLRRLILDLERQKNLYLCELSELPIQWLLTL
jgi:hypothetical protein